LSVTPDRDTTMVPTAISAAPDSSTHPIPASDSALARLVDGAAGGADHVAHTEFLDGDEIVVAHKPGGGLLDPVPASVRLAGAQSSDRGLRSTSTVRAFVLAGEASLQPS